ncbi:MAG: exodeoxyribonuclease VII large subunit, partial [Chitinophagales bacterium]|nr:exodeoxyribonuclease VII large subunit [Chitinophagales bacterium]
MHHQQTLTDLLNDIQDTLQARFEGEAFWIHATAMNVKRQPTSRRCYLTLEDYEGSTKTAEAKAVFWANSYNEIESFEKATGQKFKDGIQIICKVRIRYHKVYGLNLDVIGIDFAHT